MVVLCLCAAPPPPSPHLAVGGMKRDALSRDTTAKHKQEEVARHAAAAGWTVSAKDQGHLWQCFGVAIGVIGCSTTTSPTLLPISPLHALDDLHQAAREEEVSLRPGAREEHHVNQRSERVPLLAAPQVTALPRHCRPRPFLPLIPLIAAEKGPKGEREAEGNEESFVSQTCGSTNFYYFCFR